MRRHLIPFTTLFLFSGCVETADAPPTPRASEDCSYPASLEITSVNIGQGDATIIATPTRIVLADTGESYWNSHADALTIDSVLQSKYGCTDVDYVVLSHLQVDHVGYPNYGGLWYLAETLGYTIGETLIRDYLGNIGTTSGTYDNWVTYLGSAQGQQSLHPRTPDLGEQIDLGDGITLTIVNIDTRTASCPDGWGSAPDGSCGGEYVSPSEVLGDHSADYPAPSENDYSIGFVVSVGDFDMYIGGDTSGENGGSFGTEYHDVESYLAADVGEVDVLRVNHHGSDHSSNPAFIAALQPQAGLISVGNANTYGHARQNVIDRLLGVVDGVPTRPMWLYMTERGDDGIGGCLQDYASSDEAAAELYNQATIVSDTDGDYCTIEGGDVDIVVSYDGSAFTVEGTPYASTNGVPSACNGNGICEAGEDCIDCPADCPASNGASCGNGICELSDGEDCVSCPADCNGKQSGKPSNQFCCGVAAGTNPVDCGDARCSENGFVCTNDPAVGSCCGDGSCTGNEDGTTCELDCGPPPSCGDGTCNGSEDVCSCATDCGTPAPDEVPGVSCGDGVDNDCDGVADCADADCASEPACAPACNGDGVCDPGEDCQVCPDECDGRTNGPPSSRFCCGNGVAEGPEGDGSLCDDND